MLAKRKVSWLALLWLVCVAWPGAVTINGQDAVAVATPAHIDALKAADDARVAAMRKPNKDQLSAVFADDLHYTHSNGNLDTKQSFIEVLTSGKTKYVGFDYEKREFTMAAPGIALMTGRARVQAATADATMDSVLSFLAVWRLEKGQWRFLAWQSCRVPPPATSSTTNPTTK